MLVSLRLLTFLVASAYSCRDSYLLRYKFQEFLITPQVIPYPPIDELTIIFGEYRANFGNIIPQCDTVQEPLTSWPNPDSDGLYTLVGLVLPTLGSRSPNGTAELNGLIFNIPGTNKNDGDRVVGYIPPNPPLGGRYRRYVGLVYRQPERIEVTTDVLLSYVDYKYTNFSLNEFVTFYQLGNPIAGNFFRVKQSPCENQCADAGRGNGGCSNGYNGYNSGYNNGCNNGYNNGCSNGCSNGYSNGCNNGYNNGYSNGYNDNYNNGCNNNYST